MSVSPLSISITDIPQRPCSYAGWSMIAAMDGGTSGATTGGATVQEISAAEAPPIAATVTVRRVRRSMGGSLATLPTPTPALGVFRGGTIYMY